MTKTRSFGPWWKRALCFFGIHTDCHFYAMNTDERKSRQASLGEDVDAP
jgi:hypothetical protein